MTRRWFSEPLQTVRVLVLLSRLDVDTPVAVIVGWLVLLGLGVGVFTSPTASAILGSAPRERRGVASGILSTARGLGMVVGFGLGGTVFTAVVGRLGQGVTPASVTVAADATLFAAAVLATLATVALLVRPSSTGDIALAVGPSNGSLAWPGRRGKCDALGARWNLCRPRLTDRSR